MAAECRRRRHSPARVGRCQITEGLRGPTRNLGVILKQMKAAKWFQAEEWQDPKATSYNRSGYYSPSSTCSTKTTGPIRQFPLFKEETRSECVGVGIC